MAAYDVLEVQVKIPMTLRIETLLEMKRRKNIMKHEVDPLIDELLYWRGQWNSGQLVLMNGELLSGVVGDFVVEKIPSLVFTNLEPLDSWTRLDDAQWHFVNVTGNRLILMKKVVKK